MRSVLGCAASGVRATAARKILKNVVVASTPLRNKNEVPGQKPYDDRNNPTEPLQDSTHHDATTEVAQTTCDGSGGDENDGRPNARRENNACTGDFGDIEIARIPTLWGDMGRGVVLLSGRALQLKADRSFSEAMLRDDSPETSPRALHANGDPLGVTNSKIHEGSAKPSEPSQHLIGGKNP